VEQVRKFGDVISINAFVAAHPDRARAVFTTSRHAGLWQLDLVSERGRWVTTLTGLRMLR